MNYEESKSDSNIDKDDRPPLVSFVTSDRKSLLNRSLLFKLPEESIYNHVKERNPFLTLNLEEKCFSTTQVLNKFLSSVDEPFYVISVSGAPLTGKSTILNLIISILSQHIENDVLIDTDLTLPMTYLPIFKVGDGIKRTTDGLDYFCMRIQGKNILILDVEGDNDPSRDREGTWVYTNLITTALAISHIHLYNCNYFEQSFFSYFNSAGRIIEQNRLHEDFLLDIRLTKRNHDSSEEFWEEDLQDIRESHGAVFDGYPLTHSFHLLPRPPQDITNRRNKDSCINKDANICTKCQSDFFFTKLKKFTLGLLDDVLQKKPYQNGKELLLVVQKILEHNKEALPFTLNMGYIAQIRSAKLDKEYQRINQKRNELGVHGFEQALAEDIKELINIHPKLFQDTASREFTNLTHRLMTKFGQLYFLMHEFSKFLESCLTDKSFTVLDLSEKTRMMDVYVTPFQDTFRDLVATSKDYEVFIEKNDFSLVKENVGKFLTDYKNQKFDVDAQSYLMGVNTVSFTVVGMFARDAAVRILMWAGLAGGSGILLVLSVLAMMKASKMLREGKKKAKENLNLGQIPEENQGEEKEDLERIVEFLEEKFKLMERKRAGLNGVLKTGSEDEEEEDERIEKLFKSVDRVLVMRLHREEITQREVERIRGEFEAVTNKIIRIREFL